MTVPMTTDSMPLTPAMLETVQSAIVRLLPARLRGSHQAVVPSPRFLVAPRQVQAGAGVSIAAPLREYLSSPMSLQRLHEADAEGEVVEVGVAVILATMSRDQLCET